MSSTGGRKSDFERGQEIVQDYGMVRIVNVEQKGGGNYLPENATWAKQSIAHNTLVLDEISHFAGVYETGSQHHSELRFFDAERKDVQVVSALERNAYPGTEMRRTVAMIKGQNFQEPFVLDLWQVTSEDKHQYDLPYYYMGQLLETSFEYDAKTSLSALGESHGYQHLYLEASGKATSDMARFTWMGPMGFYTLTSVTEMDDALLLARIGANDPDFNLRREPVFILRREQGAETAFATVIESHGSYSPVTERAVNSRSSISNLAIVYDDERYTAVAIHDLEGAQSIFIVANQDTSSDVKHKLELAGIAHVWEGPYSFIGPF